jgi:hypothetical protein
MGTAAGIIILLVVLLLAAGAVWVTKGAGPLNPSPPTPPISGLAAAIANAQSSSSSALSTLGGLTGFMNGTTQTGINLYLANEEIPNAPALDTSALAAALSSYNKALQGQGGVQDIFSSYNAAVQKLSASSDLGAIIESGDSGALALLASQVQSGAQSMSDAINNSISIINANAAHAHFTITGTWLSDAATQAQAILGTYGSFLTAAKQASAASATLVQIAEGVTQALRQPFTQSPCRAVIPTGRDCDPPFAVCASEKCRVGAGCSDRGAYWHSAYENPIIASGAGLTIWP